MAHEHTRLTCRGVVKAPRQDRARTQNSWPSGSARHVHGTSPWPRSRSVAPRARSRATSAALSSPGSGTRSRWTRSGTVFTPVRRNSRYGPTPLAERHTAWSSVTSCRVQSIASSQNSDVRVGVRVREGGGVPSSEERHAGGFLLALGETGTGGGDAGCRIHLVRAHCGSGIGVRCDHLDAAALLAQGLDLAC